MFYAEIQDGRQKWRENNFWGYSLEDSVEALGVKNVVKIALSCTVFEINAFLPFTQKFKMAAKNCGKTNFGETRQ